MTTTKQRSALTGGTLAILAVLFVAAIVLTNTLFRGARLDLTENRLYTLTEGTRQVIAEIKEPVNLYLFFSDRATRDIPQLRNYATRVREMLEEIADSLPHSMNAGKCAKAAETLEPLVKRIHAFEEHEVFPRYAAANPGPVTAGMLERLREEHCVDECYAEELSDALRRVASTSDPISADTLGYMLRGFFEAMRRHQAFENVQFLGGK